MTDPNILEEQLEYYRARAGEYDEWFLREGRYERGPEHRDAWFDEVVQVETALRNQFERFWTNVRASLKDGGQVFFVDGLLEQSSTARDHEQLNRSGFAKRRLNDGREFRIVKMFYDPIDLERRLRTLGWDGWIRLSGQFFSYGSLKTAGRTDHDRRI